MHALLVVLRNCSIHEGGRRRDLRPGTIINATEELARTLVSKGYARHVIEPAPLFVNSTDPPKKPKKEKTHGDFNELNRDARADEGISRSNVDNG